MKPTVLVLDVTDTVATTLQELAAGQSVDVPVAGQPTRITLREAIAPGHKFAVLAMARGDAVRKYGVVIGRASEAIAVGAHVHVHNLESCRGRGDRPAGETA